MPRVGTSHLQEHDEVLVHPDGNLVLIGAARGVGLAHLLPLVLVGGLLGAAHVEPADLVDEALHAGLGPAAGDELALAELVAAQAQGGVGAVQQGLHDGGVLAGVDAGHLDVVGEEGEVLERDRLVLVVADDVVHHGRRRQRLPAGAVAREVEARRTVVRAVHDVEGVGAAAAVKGGLDAVSWEVWVLSAEFWVCLRSLGSRSSVFDDGLVVILVLHVRDLVVVVVLIHRVAHVARVIHSPHLLGLQRLRAGQAAGAQPAVLIIIAAVLARAAEVVAVVDEGLLVAGVAREVVVQAAVAGDVARDQVLLALGQVGDAARLVVGVAPRPRRELVHQVVAGGQELLGRDLPRAAEGRRVRHGRVAVPQGVDGGLDVLHGEAWGGGGKVRFIGKAVFFWQ